MTPIWFPCAASQVGGVIPPDRGGSERCEMARLSLRHANLGEQRLAHVHASPRVVQTREHRKTGDPKLTSWTPMNP